MIPGARKKRILCLHGYRQCAKTFREKLGALRKLLKSEVEFVFLEASHAVNGNNGIGILKFSQHPLLAVERSWWFTSDDLTFSSRLETDICIGFEQSLSVVKTVCLNDGPFDGLLGFSQGAAFAGILCALNDNEIQFSFVILVAGFKSLVTSHTRFYNNPINLPSLHVIGDSDAVICKELSEELQNCFQSNSRETFYHNGGHFVPANKLVKLAYSNFIEKCFHRNNA